MDALTVACCALNQTPLDWEGNLANIRRALDEARSLGAGILCLPELCVTGYGCEDWFLSAGVQERALECVHSLLPATKGLFTSFGIPVRVEGKLYDAVAVAADGKLQGIVCKHYLAREGIHYEVRFFDPWEKGRRTTIRIAGHAIPVGDLVFALPLGNSDEVRIGFEICEDAWSTHRPGSDLATSGVDLLLNPSASHFAFGKYKTRERFVCEGARAFGCAYLYANLLGNEAGRAIYDGETFIAVPGKLLSRGRPLGFGAVRMISATLSLADIRGSRQRSYGEAEKSGKIRVVKVRSPLPSNPAGGKSDVFPEYSKEEEFGRAAALALFDYLRKSGARGFVLSLSGGADSAAIACMVRLALRLSCHELGFETVRAVFPWAKNARTEEEMMQKLLLCVYQRTKNSSETTEKAAQAVAAAVGAAFHVIDIEPLVSGYRALAEEVAGREFSWNGDDITLQNIQARVRSPSVWMLANERGSLLLATSNRSEASVGYTTMDGDTSGSISPIAGVDKQYVRRWLRWHEKAAPEGGEPVPALRLVNEQIPTAELRPHGSRQTDEADLMPYELLNRIEALAIGAKKMPAEVFRLLTVESPDLDKRTLAQAIEKFFALWSRNQWKRERYAPSFHFDVYNVDSRTWCRFPILSGGFKVEIQEMWKLAGDS